MNVILEELLLNMAIDLRWLIQGIFRFHVILEAHMVASTDSSSAHITLNPQIPNFSIINQNVGEILRNTSTQF